MSATIYPTYKYRDARGAIDWLGRAFGFEPVAVHPPEGDTVAHAELRLGGAIIMLGSDGAGDPNVHQAAGTGSAYVGTDDIDARYERAVAAGAEVVRPLNDTDYGSREFSVRDPEGNVWSFGTYRP
jgi:uncharacterized glyoxalase superfamily protein PhnB